MYEKNSGLEKALRDKQKRLDTQTDKVLNDPIFNVETHKEITSAYLRKIAGFLRECEGNKYKLNQIKVKAKKAELTYGILKTHITNCGMSKKDDDYNVVMKFADSLQDKTRGKSPALNHTDKEQKDSVQGRGKRKRNRTRTRTRNRTRVPYGEAAAAA